MEKAGHVLLLPGEYRISSGAEIIETLVGSCVTVCLYNSKTRHAAMNHFLRDGREYECGGGDMGRFGSSATEYIIKALMESDPIASHYCAQIFGGAAVVKTVHDNVNIGEKNVDIAREVLAEYRIRIIREEVGGTRGRRVRFDTSTNTVFCRFAGQVGKKYREDAGAN